MSELTDRQRAFIEQLPRNQWNGTKAAIAAGYAENSAAVMACRLLKDPKITAELDKRTVEIAEKNNVEVGEIIAALRKIAFGVKATNSERLKALDLLGRHLAMFAERHVIETPERQRELDVAECREAARLAELLVIGNAPRYEDQHRQELVANTDETTGKEDANDDGQQF